VGTLNPAMTVWDERSLLVSTLRALTHELRRGGSTIHGGDLICDRAYANVLISGGHPLETISHVSVVYLDKRL
jgi:hypothetical protein